MPNVRTRLTILLALVDVLTRELLDARKNVIGERSGNIVRDTRDALIEINSQREQAGLDPITEAEAESWPGQLTEEPDHA